MRFLSTLSLRRATGPMKKGQVYYIRFLSTLSLRRATSPHSINCMTHTHFYPRSPCGERLYNLVAGSQAKRISIHALLAESDPLSFASCLTALLFLSTLSLRRATVPGPAGQHGFGISIHALLAESDRSTGCWGHPHQISIHALLAESDPARMLSRLSLEYFYPRSPCGERHS